MSTEAEKKKPVATSGGYTPAEQQSPKIEKEGEKVEVVAEAEGEEEEKATPKTWQDHAKNVSMGSAVFAVLWIFSVATTSWPGFEQYTLPAAGEIDSGSTAWMLVASALVLLMTPGLGFFYGGMVRAKNIITTVMQTFAAVGVISVLWVFFLFSLCFGSSQRGFIGNPATYFLYRNVGAGVNGDYALGIPFVLYSIFQLMFAVITPALISGTFSERINFTAFCLFISLWSIFVYAPIAHTMWHPDGLFRAWGVLDFAGGTVVHMSSGFSALAGAVYLGPGQPFKNKEKHSPPHVPFVLLGTAMLLFGWYGFNAGSALASDAIASQAFLNTHMAAASAMLTWLFCDYWRGNKLSASGACIGLVVGLVGVTPAAGFVNTGAAIIIGILTCIGANILGDYMKEKTSIDDTLDVFSCHGLGGIIGMLLTGCFASEQVDSFGSPGAFYGDGKLLGKHIAAILIISPYFFIVSYFLYTVTDMIIPLRAHPEAEEKGLDASHHGESMHVSIAADDLASLVRRASSVLATDKTMVEEGEEGEAGAEEVEERAVEADAEATKEDEENEEGGSKAGSAGGSKPASTTSSPTKGGGGGATTPPKEEKAAGSGSPEKKKKGGSSKGTTPPRKGAEEAAKAKAEETGE